VLGSDKKSDQWKKKKPKITMMRQDDDEDKQSIKRVPRKSVKAYDLANFTLKPQFEQKSEMFNRNDLLSETGRSSFHINEYSPPHLNFEDDASFAGKIQRQISPPKLNKGQSFVEYSRERRSSIVDIGDIGSPHLSKNRFKPPKMKENK
jgi:hypothetical protein